MVNMPEKKWITRKEIIQQTGLSGPELDEYIAIGILPDPVSRDMDAQFPGAEKKEIFPISVIWRVNLVNRLKEQGESLETIAGQFGDLSTFEEISFPGEREQISIPKQNTGFENSNSRLTFVHNKTDNPDNAEEEDAPILLENEISQKPVKVTTSENSSPETDEPPRRQEAKIAKAVFGDKKTCAVSVSILYVKLQNIDKLADMLMPEDYFEVLNQIYGCLYPCVFNHNGIKTDLENDQLCCCFFKQEKTNYILDSISCACDMQAQMKDLNQKIRQVHQADEEICLNIGIAEGHEISGFLKYDGDIVFRVLGVTSTYAKQLSEFAKNGEIWATKSGIGKMLPEDAKAISFGVPRLMNNQVHFIPNTFSKVKHLISDDSLEQKWVEIEGLPVTFVKGLAPKKNS